MQTPHREFMKFFFDILSPLELLIHQVLAGFYSQSGTMALIQALMPAMNKEIKPEQFLNVQYVELPVNGDHLLSIYEPFLKKQLEFLMENLAMIESMEEKKNREKTEKQRTQEAISKFKEQIKKVFNVLEDLNRKREEILPRSFLYTFGSELLLLSHYLYDCGKVVFEMIQAENDIQKGNQNGN